VLLVAPLPPPVGGIASWTKNVMTYFQALEKKEVNLQLCDSSNKNRRITSRSTLQRIYQGIQNSFRIYKQVKNSLVNKPDVIHLVSSASFSVLKDLLILNLAKRNKIPVVTHWRFGRIPELSEQKNWEYKLLAKVINKSAFSIVIDKQSYNTLVDNGFTNILQMPNPLAADLGEKTAYLKQNYVPRPVNELLFVGHVVVDKGVFELVEACTRIQEVKQLTLVGPYEIEIQNQLTDIAKERVNGTWLKFTGALDKVEVMKLMQAHAILVLASYSEGFPNAVLEGEGNGCAIIGSFVGAIPEMLDIDSEKPCGICVPHKNTEALEEAIRKCIANSAEVRSMGINGLNKVLNSYTMDKVFSEYVHYWKKSVTKA